MGLFCSSNQFNTTVILFVAGLSILFYCENSNREIEHFQKHFQNSYCKLEKYDTMIAMCRVSSLGEPFAVIPRLMSVCEAVGSNREKLDSK